MSPRLSRLRLRRVVIDHYGFLFAVLRRAGLDVADAEDVAQQTLLVLVRRIDDVAVGAERSFLFVTAMRVASRARRGWARRREVFDEAAVQAAIAPAAAVDDALGEHRARALLDAAIARLPEELRVVLLLADFEERTMADVARTLAIPAGTVASRLRRARENLERELEKFAVSADAPARAAKKRALLALGLSASSITKLLKLAWASAAAFAVALLFAATPHASHATAFAPHALVDAARGGARTFFAPSATPAPVAIISGHVFSDAATLSSASPPAPAPVVGAVVTFAASGAEYSVTTDGAGAFRFAAPHAGAFRVRGVSHPDYANQNSDEQAMRIQVAAGQEVKGVTLHMTPREEPLIGVVVDRAGRKVAGARVRSLGDVVEPVDVTTADDGTFAFTPGFAVLEASHAEKGWGRARAFDPDANSLVIHLTHDGARERELITGHVVDANGLPLDGIRVTAVEGSWSPQARDDDPIGLTRAVGVSQYDGSFVIEVFKKERYRLSATDDDGAFSRAQFAHAGDDVSLTIESGLAFAGRAYVANTRAPLTAFAIELRSQSGDASEMTPRYYTRTFYNATGAFALRGLQPGEYRVKVTADDFAPAPPRTITITKDSTQNEFAMVHGAVVTGRVIDAVTGLPLVATVSLEGPTLGEPAIDIVPFRYFRGAAPAAPAAPAAVDGGNTRADGTFMLEHVAPGAGAITAARAGYEIGYQAVSVAVDGAVDVRTIALVPMGAGAGEKVGIGASFVVVDGALKIVTITPGGSAEAAGLRVGESVFAVAGGTGTEMLGGDNLLASIAGPAGTAVRLLVEGTPLMTVVSVPRYAAAGP